MKDLMKGARIAVNQCMRVKPEEKVLIITDRRMPKNIPETLFKAVKEVGAECSIEEIKPLERDGQEPEKKVVGLMKSVDVLFLVTSKSLSHTKARREASKAGVRIASMPGVTEFSFTEGGLTTDYNEVDKLCKLMFNKVKDSKEFHITSKNGTDITMKVGKYTWTRDNGLFHKPGDFGNLPAGEVETAPIEGTTSGILVIDKWGRYGDNIELTIEKGYVKKIKGSKLLKKDIDELGMKAKNIAEIGIGTNPKARIIGNVLEDEKVFGTIHIALGNNKFWGGKVDVPFHVDGIILRPTLKADDRILIKNGKWTFI